MTSSPVLCPSSDRRVSVGRRPSQLQLNAPHSQLLKVAEAPSSDMDQIHFSGQSSCPKFVPNSFKPSMCRSCAKVVASHRKEAVSEDDVKPALEYLVDSVPSLVLERKGDYGPVYLGGYKAAMNTKFLTEEAKLSHVLTAAQGLGEVFGPLYKKAIDEAKNKGIIFLEMNWLDKAEENITMDDLNRVVRFVEKGRTEGTGVLLHCAQGKSRSGMATIAYVMSKLGKNFEESLAFVQEQRRMAEPNFGFMIALKEFEKSPELALLREEIGLRTAPADQTEDNADK